VKGGSGWGKSGEGDGRSWTRSGRGARGGGKEAVGQRNLGGGERSRRISGEKGAAAALFLVVARKEDRGRNSRRMELGPVL
jgi:hypothetical protein